MSQHSRAVPRGSYHDRLFDEHGRLVRDRGWHSNRIVSTCHRLLAALMKGGSGLGGILYLAVGEGDVAWDGAVPTPPADAAQLVHEWLRLPIAADQIQYLDGDGSQPSDQLQITVTLVGAELVAGDVKSLREFGLFGGDASAAAGSGMLINYVIHPRIDLTPHVTLTRRLQLHFGAISPAELVPTRPQPMALGLASVKYLDGVGEAYAAALAGAGFATLAALAEADLESATVAIPAAKLVEAQAKAILALNSAAKAAAVPLLASRTPADLTRLSTAALIAESGASEAAVVEARTQAAALQVALDAKFLGRSTIEELTQPAVYMTAIGGR